MARFRVTYNIVTPESAEHGDVAEHGFIMPGQWRYAFGENYSQADDYSMSLREAVNLLGCCEDSGNWFTETDGSQNYRTGAVETRSLHPPRNITGASYNRLSRLLRAS